MLIAPPNPLVPPAAELSDSPEPAGLTVTLPLEVRLIGPALGLAALPAVVMPPVIARLPTLDTVTPKVLAVSAPVLTLAVEVDVDNVGAPVGVPAVL